MDFRSSLKCNMNLRLRVGRIAAQLRTGFLIKKYIYIYIIHFKIYIYIYIDTYKYINIYKHTSIINYKYKHI